MERVLSDMKGHRFLSETTGWRWCHFLRWKIQKDDQFGVVMIVGITQFFFFYLLFDLPLNLKNGVDNEVVGKLNDLGQSLERPRAFNCW